MMRHVIHGNLLSPRSLTNHPRFASLHFYQSSSITKFDAELGFVAKNDF